MPIARRFRGVNLNSDKDMPAMERRKTMLQPRPGSGQLLASIAHLRTTSSSKKLDHSKRLIEKSRRIIFETELSLTRDD